MGSTLAILEMSAGRYRWGTGGLQQGTGRHGSRVQSKCWEIGDTGRDHWGEQQILSETGGDAVFTAGPSRAAAFVGPK